MSSSSQVAESWISSFCSLLGHEYFAEVSEDFIEDDFNLTGLAAQVPMYKEALEMILDVEPEEDEDDEDEELDEDELDDEDQLGDDVRGYRRADRRHMRMASDLSVIEGSAELLYGLIHQRYILSRPGMQQMLEKYELCHFGHCPRVHCNGAKVLPVGCSDTPGQETVKLFCPSCLDIYTPPNSRFQTVDGAFFGTTFGCLFFMTFPELEVGQPRTEQQVAIQANGSTSSIGITNAVGNGATPDTAGTSRVGSISSQILTPSSATKLPLPPQPSSINGISTSNLAPGLGANNIYEPRIYGFRVSERARTGPRMQWLRSKPADITELDEARRYREEMGVDSDGEEIAVDEEEELGGDSAMPDAPAAAPPSKSERRRVVPATGAVRGAGRRAKASAVNMNANGSPMEVVDGGNPAPG